MATEVKIEKKPGVSWYAWLVYYPVSFIYGLIFWHSHVPVGNVRGITAVIPLTHLTGEQWRMVLGASIIVPIFSGVVPFIVYRFWEGRHSWSMATISFVLMLVIYYLASHHIPGVNNY